MTLMSSYAGLTSLEIHRGAVNEMTLSNLEMIKHEAIRLANLVEPLKDLSMGKERRLDITDIRTSALLKHAADSCEPVCRKNDNEIRFSEESGSFILCAIAESTFQCC